jgi:hypothetical protein
MARLSTEISNPSNRTNDCKAGNSEQAVHQLTKPLPEFNDADREKDIRDKVLEWLRD